MKNIWWHNEENIHLLADWLINEVDYFDIYETRVDALDALLYLIEKPWKYEKEWIEYQQNRED